MIRISPSKPPPMYMEFPFINNCDAAFDHEADALFVRYRTLNGAESTYNDR
jgi:hypothetical protein